MRLILLSFSFLLAASFSLVTYLEGWFQGWAGNRAQSANILNVALGDSRRLFATHYYVKADAYFHSGYYPTIYDRHLTPEEMHMAGHSRAAPEEHEEGDFLGKPKDWLDAFSRHFYPSKHRHLGEPDEPEDHHQGEDHAPRKIIPGEEREVLPWLRLSASLDPERPETYIVASFWLRSRLGKINEAEQFLREGLQSNPFHYELLLELGQIYYENRNDAQRARHLWELGLRNWRESESGKAEPNLFPYAQLLGNLATLEEKEHHYFKAIEHLAVLKQISPNKDSLHKWIADLQARIPKG